MLTQANIVQALALLTKSATKLRIATADDRKNFWTRVMEDETIDWPHRLKASELLGKTGADFIERQRTEGKIEIQVIRGGKK